MAYQIALRLIARHERPIHERPTGVTMSDVRLLFENSQCRENGIVCERRGTDPFDDVVVQRFTPRCRSSRDSQQYSGESSVGRLVEIEVDRAGARCRAHGAEVLHRIRRRQDAGGGPSENADDQTAGRRGCRDTAGRVLENDTLGGGDAELIETGPYRFVRHPIYTGLLLALE